MKIELPDGETHAYIFDCDGTLADSMPMHYRAWKQAFEKNSAKFPFTWELFYSMAGAGMYDSVVILNERYQDDLDPDTVVRDQDQFLRHELDSVEPIHQVVELAKELKEKGFPIAVASGGDRAHVESTLTYCGIIDLFDAIVTKNDVERSKPAPDGFLKAAELLSVAPEKCVVFEDSQLGITAAETCGMRWVFIDPEIYSGGAGI
ncbi:MAG: HAD family phosphatase [Verrucomicrobiota bacterium]